MKKIILILIILNILSINGFAQEGAKSEKKEEALCLYYGKNRCNSVVTWDGIPATAEMASYCEVFSFFGCFYITEKGIIGSYAIYEELIPMIQKNGLSDIEKFLKKSTEEFFEERN